MKIGLDTNILIYAIDSSSEFHKKTISWLNSTSYDFVCPSTVIGETLRLLTHSKVFNKPLTTSKAVAVVENFLESYTVDLIPENENWWKELKELSEKDALIKGNIIFDARICLCLKFNSVSKIASFDSDLDRFKFIKRISP